VLNVRHISFILGLGVGITVHSRFISHLGWCKNIRQSIVITLMLSFWLLYHNVKGRTFLNTVNHFDTFLFLETINLKSDCCEISLFEHLATEGTFERFIVLLVRREVILHALLVHAMSFVTRHLNDYFNWFENFATDWAICCWTISKINSTNDRFT